MGSPLPAAVTRPEIGCCARAAVAHSSRSVRAGSQFPLTDTLDLDIGLASQAGTARTYSKHFDNASPSIRRAFALDAAGLAGDPAATLGGDPCQSNRLLSRGDRKSVV